MFKNNDNSMSPNASPTTEKKTAGTRRVNNLPIYIIGSIITGVVLSMAFVIGNKSSQNNTEEEVKVDPSSNNSKVHAQAVIGEYTHGVIPAQTDDSEMLNPPSNQPIKNGSAQELIKSEEITLQQVPRNEDLERIRTIKIQQLDAAVKAKTKIPVNLGKTAAQNTDPSYAVLSATGRSNDPTAAYKTQLAQLQRTNTTGGSTTGNLEGHSGFSSASKEPNNASAGDRWFLDSAIEAPRTPYEIRAGFVVPATLISGINSELPGQINAQVAQNVYDTPTGKFLLIPQGSKLFGIYSSDVAYGQSRVLVAWQRITYPDGKVLDIGEMPGADSAGYSGFHDQVNNHYLRIFGSAIMMSAITAGFSYSQDVNEEDNWFSGPTASSELSAALGQQLGDVASQMIAKNLNIAPTLEIRPGYRFNVMLTKDLTFSQPYQSFDY